MLRDYQQRSIDQLYSWFAKNPTGNPCLVLPTGSGKSHVIAALVKDAVQTYKGTRILMLVHSKELISQNAEKLRQHWSDAPMGIYSASLGKRELSQAITFAGIQSVRNKGTQLGHIDLCIIDECHAIAPTQTGGYRKLIASLTETNPNLRVIGLTASPYRLGHGMIHEGDDVIFNALIEPVGIEELVKRGYLCTLRSKHTQLTYSTDGVRKAAGDYVASALEAVVNTSDNNERVVNETIARASDRRSWLVFCAGVSHAHEVADLFAQKGIKAACVTGDTPMQERDDILRRFKAGELQAVTNVNVLTTGFDHPNIDCIVFLRPTMSPGLYYQMAGRGLRIADGKKDCLVLDFGGNVSTHGPITAIQPPKRKGKGTGEAVTKTCPECEEVVTAAIRLCPSCGFEFKFKEKDDLALRNDDIMGFDSVDMSVRLWAWRVHTSKVNGKQMLKVTYYGELSDPPVDEYFTVLHDGYAGTKARESILAIAARAGADPRQMSDLPSSVAVLQRGTPPKQISYRRKGKFYQVERKKWAIREST